MLAYYNFVLTDEVAVTTRQKYTWLDSFAFVGGNVDVLIVLMHMFFFFYNFGLNRYQQYYIAERDRLLSLGQGLSKECQFIDEHRNTLNVRLLVFEILSQFKCLDRWVKAETESAKTVSIYHLRKQIKQFHDEIDIKHIRKINQICGQDELIPASTMDEISMMKSEPIANTEAALQNHNV